MMPETIVSEPAPVPPGHLAERWWAVALRGIFAILFGVLALAAPKAVLLSLALLFGIYAIADGVAELFAAVGAARADQRWALLALAGAVSIAAGCAALLLPQLTVMVFVFVIGLRAAFGGVLALMAAPRLDPEHGRGWLVLSGLASIVLAVALFTAPVAGAVVLTWWIGSYALVFGGLLLVLAYRLRAARRGA